MNVDQEAAFEAMRARLFELFGPGGSFRITLGRASVDDAVFVSTVADTIAWTVAAGLESTAQPVGRRVDIADPEEAEYRRVWKHVEAELLRRRDDEDALSVDLPHAHHAA